MQHPSAFISYSWDGPEHQNWVRELAARLRGDGIDVTLDQWHTALGDQLPQFMERSIRTNDYVLIICTPKYKARADGRLGGVGYEGDIIQGEVLSSANHRKFVPILRGPIWAESAPVGLLGKSYSDFRGDPYRKESYEQLLMTLWGVLPAAPPLGANLPKAVYDQPAAKTDATCVVRITRKLEEESSASWIDVITFYWNYRFNKGVPFTVLEDGNEKAWVGNGGSTLYLTTPGKHELQVSYSDIHSGEMEGESSWKHIGRSPVLHVDLQLGVNEFSCGFNENFLAKHYADHDTVNLFCGDLAEFRDG